MCLGVHLRTQWPWTASPFSHNSFGLHLWRQSYKKRQRSCPSSIQISSAQQQNIHWFGTAQQWLRGKSTPQPAAEQTKKIARKTVDIIKGQPNPFIFLKVLMRNSCAFICNATPVLPSTSYQLLGLPDLSKKSLGDFTVQAAKQLTLNTQDQSLGKDFTPTYSVLPIIALEEAASSHYSCAFQTVLQYRFSPT